MCSQPPKDKDDVESLTKRNEELIRLMDPAPSHPQSPVANQPCWVIIYSSS